MDKNGIDNLLQIVSPELLAGYEAKNLDGKTLRGVYEEYKVVSAKRKKIIIAKFGAGLSILWIFVIAFLAVFMPYKGVSLTLTGMTVVVAFSAWTFLLGRSLNTAWGYNRTIAQCEEVLESFRQSVEALDSRWEMASFGYTPSNIKKWLVGHAMRLINAEKQFLEARFDKSVPAEYAFHFYSTEVNSRGLFEKALTAAEKFGLTFKNPDLFRDAEKYIAQTK